MKSGERSAAKTVADKANLAASLPAGLLNWARETGDDYQDTWPPRGAWEPTPEELDDRLESDDKFMRHLAQVVRNGLGDRAGTCIDPKTQIVQGRTVGVVSCERSPEPVSLQVERAESGIGRRLHRAKRAWHCEAAAREYPGVHPDAVRRADAERSRVSPASGQAGCPLIWYAHAAAGRAPFS